MLSPILFSSKASFPKFGGGEEYTSWRRFLTQQGTSDPDAFIRQRKALVNTFEEHLKQKGIQNSSVGVAYYTPSITFHYDYEEDGQEIIHALKDYPGLSAPQLAGLHPRVLAEYTLDHQGQPWKVIVQDSPYGCGFRLDRKLERDRLERLR